MHPAEEPTLPDPDVAAAELALGVLDGDERAVALRRQLADPAFAREVQQWRDHFATFFARSQECAAPDGVAERIEAHLDRTTAGAPSPVGLWRSFALASSLVAATLAGVLVMRPGDPQTIAPVPALQVQLVAAMALSDGKSAPLPAYYDPTRKLVRMPGPMPIPAGHSAQLWAVNEGHRPVPLGLFHVVGNTVVAEARTSQAIAAGTTLVISFEPLGGSPTGRPTAPFIASGALSKI